MASPTTATRLMDEIVSTHSLSDLEKVFHSSASLQLVVASAEAVSFFDYRRLDSSSFTVQVSGNRDHYTFYSMTTLPMGQRGRIVFTSSRGKLYIVDGDGVMIREQTLSDKSLWHVTHAQMDGRTYLFACCADGTLRVLDELGESLGTIEMPGQPLSVDIKRVNGGVKLVAGMQHRNQVFLWDWADMIEKHDASPEAILRGGTKPAFSTRFVEIGTESWIIQGCWDNNVYLYQQRFENSAKVISPSLFLRGASPIYPIECIGIEGRSYLFAGTESGEIHVWRLAAEFLRNGKRPDYTVARLGDRVKCMMTARIAGQFMLFAGCQNGRLHIFQLDVLEPPRLVTTIEIGKGEVRGIGFL